MKRIFFIKALWDENAKVFYSESDIEGLHIEAPTIDVFEEVIFDTAIELIVENHMSAADVAGTAMKDLIPAILWERPSTKAIAA
ncbi:DUF1902 domain-containing protein [Neorhizobium sp. CSC1952]|uniref:DUF1902 domain-containing protein n=1 Tax=Xaviernesmea oryzae TaxID=464029 RepID=A0A1X7F2K4_9HYPH|nr:MULTISPECIES: DUF1902 domain-containing protein [Rhizobium/Agrobacterium group]WJR67985.1 DUF1902 domain-containing protein [Rhizobium sp. CSC1952]SMF44821.1 protein of unknown function [Xaviernesmea oryzae]